MNEGMNECEICYHVFLFFHVIILQSVSLSWINECDYYYIVWVVGKVFLSSLREVIDPGILNESSEDEEEAHKEEDV